MAKFTKAQQTDLNVVKAHLREAMRKGGSKAKQEGQVKLALARLTSVVEANK